MAKHREFWKNKDPQLSMSGASGAAGTQVLFFNTLCTAAAPLPADGGIWYFVDINKKV